MLIIKTTFNFLLILRPCLKFPKKRREGEERKKERKKEVHTDEYTNIGICEGDQRNPQWTERHLDIDNKGEAEREWKKRTDILCSVRKIGRASARIETE